MKAPLLQRIGPFLILAYGLLVIYYFSTGLLAFLVNPFYNGLILGGGVILIILGLYWILNLKHYRLTDCEKRSTKKDFSLIVLLLIPLIIAPIFKPQLLSSASAISRGVTSDLSSSSFDPTVFAKPTDQRTLIEWVRILNMDPEPDHYKDQNVIIEGKVIIEEKGEKNRFQLGQFVMTCCAADARVIALPVEYDPEKFYPKKDEWIQVKGVIKEAMIENHRQVIIQLTSGKTLPTPKDAYEIIK